MKKLEKKTNVLIINLDSLLLRCSESLVMGQGTFLRRKDSSLLLKACEGRKLCARQLFWASEESCCRSKHKRRLRYPRNQAHQWGAARQSEWNDLCIELGHPSRGAQTYKGAFLQTIASKAREHVLKLLPHQILDWTHASWIVSRDHSWPVGSLQWRFLSKLASSTQILLLGQYRRTRFPF